MERYVFPDPMVYSFKLQMEARNRHPAVEKIALTRLTGKCYKAILI